MTNIMFCEMTNEREDLISMRDELWQKLIAMIAPDAGKVANRIRTLQSMIDRIGATEPPSYKYSKYKRAIDAILDYFDDTRKPVKREVLAAALKDGGFRMGEEKQEWIIGQSINAYIHGPASVSKLIKEINGLVGKGEWPDDMFGEHNGDSNS